jgi:DNA-binding GntR family transcriptional regulator
VIPIPEIIRQLKDIYSALEKRDPETAGRLMEHHVRYFIDHIKSQLL